MIKSWKKWTSEDDEFVRSHYRSRAATWIAEELKRSAKSVKLRALVLGVTEDCVRWSDAEIATLKAEYPKMGAVGVAKLLKRSRAAVQGYASALKVGFNNPWTEEELAIIRTRYPIEGASDDLVKTLSRTKRNVSLKASTLGISYDGPCKNLGRNIGSSSVRWKGCTDAAGDRRFDVPAKAMQVPRRNARVREIPVDLTVCDISAKLRKQQGLCAKTGKPISFSDGTASVDRIDSDVGYTVENIRITSIMANLCQLYYTDVEMDQFCVDYVLHRNLLKSAAIPA